MQRNGDILKNYRREINLRTKTLKNKKHYTRKKKHKQSHSNF